MKWYGLFFHYFEQTSKILYRSGKEVSKNEFKWYTGPESVSSKKTIVLQVLYKNSEYWDGIFNIMAGSGEKHGVLCESP